MKYLAMYGMHARYAHKTRKLESQAGLATLLSYHGQNIDLPSFVAFAQAVV